MGFEQFSSRYVLYVPPQWSLSVCLCVCVSVCPSLSQRRGSCRRLLEVPHRNTRIRHRKVNRRLLLTHSCPYRNGGLCSSSQNKRVLRNTDCCCLALTIGSAPPPGGNQCSVWEGSRSQPQHGFLSLFPCAFPHLPLEHCLLCFGCILRGDECCTGGSSSSSWSCLTFSGVCSGPAELGQALVWGMLLWPQLQPCVPSTGVWLWPQCLHAGASLVPAEGASIGMGRAQYCLLSLSETHSTIPMPNVTSLFPLEPAGSLQVAVMWLQPGLYPIPI